MAGNAVKKNIVVRCALIFFVFWLLLTFPADLKSGYFWKDLTEHFIVGFALAFLVAWITKGMFILENEVSLFSLKYILRLFIYGLQLFVDIILAGIDVARRVMRPKILISPGIVEIDTPLKEDLFITINGNSITLTPGTITVDAKKTESGSRFLIHCISQDAVQDIQEGKGFIERIRKTFSIPYDKPTG